MRINYRLIPCFLIILSLSPVSLMGNNALFTYAMYAIKMVVIAYGLYLIVQRMCRTALDRFSGIFLLGFVLLAFSTFVHYGTMSALITYGYAIFAFQVMYRIVNNDVAKLIWYCTYSIVLLLICNTLLMVAIPNGIYQTLQDRYDYIASIRVNLLGYDNQLGSVVIPFLGMLFYCSLDQKFYSKAFTRISIATLLVTFIITTSTTLRITLLAYMLAYWIIRKWRLIPWRSLFVSVCVFIFVITVLQSFTIFSYFITEVLGKSMTLSNRTYIWAEAIRLIKENPVLGLGLGGTDNYIYLSISHDYRSAHNTYFQLMLRGGIPYFACMFSLMYLAVARRGNIPSHMPLTPMKLSVIVCMIGMMTEVTNMNFLLLVMFLLFLSEKDIYKFMPHTHMATTAAPVPIPV